MSVRFITTGWREKKLRSREANLSREDGDSKGVRCPTPLLVTDERAASDGTLGMRRSVTPLQAARRGRAIGYLLIWTR